MITKKLIFFLLFIKFLAFNPAYGQEIFTLAGHECNIISVAFSPDGQYVASGSSDNTIKLWNVSTGEKIRTLVGHRGSVTSVDFSPDGKLLVSGAASRIDRTIKLWDVSTGKELQTLKGHEYVGARSIAFSPDGQFLVSGGGGVSCLKLWDMSTGEEIHTISGHRGNVLNSVAFSPIGPFVASSARRDITIRLWNVLTGEEIQTIIEDFEYATPSSVDGVRSIDFSPDGQYLISTNWDNSIKLWNAFTGEEIRTFADHEITVKSVAFSPDGQYVVSGSGVWVASEYIDNAVRIWDISTGKEIQTLTGHRDYVLSVAFSPDGRYVVSGSRDNTVKLWDVFKFIASHEYPDEYPDILDRIKSSRSDLFAPRDQFETTEEYADRQQQATKYLRKELPLHIEKLESERMKQISESRHEVTLDVELINYDADNQLYKMTVGDITEFKYIDRENARSLYENRHSLVANGIKQLTLNLQSKEIININVTNPETGERYPIGKQLDIEE